MSQEFKALIAEKDSEGKLSVSIKQINESDLPEEKVLVNVEYSTLNYKDGLALTGSAPICQKFPMVCGIDLAGTVESSEDNRFKSGDSVLVNGYGLSERHWGGYSQKQKINPDFLIKIPAAFDAKDAMAIGTAGYTAMLAVNAIRDHQVKPGDGPVLVTGAAGGVGSVAVMLLSKLGFKVAASTGRPELESYLKKLGAQQIVGRDSLARKSKPLEKEEWAAVIDSVGSSTLATSLAQCQYGGIVAACGLAAGADLPTTVIPFLLRNVLLQGIDSVMAPMEIRQRAWNDLGGLLDKSSLESVTSVEPMGNVQELGASILKGQVKGRVVIDVNA